MKINKAEALSRYGERNVNLAILRYNTSERVLFEEDVTSDQTVCEFPVSELIKAVHVPQ